MISDKEGAYNRGSTFEQFGLKRKFFEIGHDLMFTTVIERSIINPTPQVMTADCILKILFKQPYLPENEVILQKLIV